MSLPSGTWKAGGAGMVPESDGAHDAGSRAARFNRHRERPLPPHPGPLPPRERKRFFICSPLPGLDILSITPPMILQSRPSFLYKNSGNL